MYAKASINLVACMACVLIAPPSEEWLRYRIARVNVQTEYLFQPPGDVSPINVVYRQTRGEFDPVTYFYREGNLLGQVDGYRLVPVAATEDTLWLWQSEFVGGDYRSTITLAFRASGSQGSGSPLVDEDGLLLWKFDLNTGTTERVKDLIPNFQDFISDRGREHVMFEKFSDEKLIFEGLLPGGKMVFSTHNSIVVVGDGEVSVRELDRFFESPSAPNTSPFLRGQVQGSRLYVSQESGCLAYNVLYEGRQTRAYWLDHWDGEIQGVQIPNDADSVRVRTISPSCDLGILTTGEMGTDVPRSYVVPVRSGGAPWALTNDMIPGYPDFREFGQFRKSFRENICSWTVPNARPYIMHLFADGSGIAYLGGAGNSPVSTEHRHQPGDIMACTFFFKKGYPSIATDHIFGELAVRQGFSESEAESLLGRSVFLDGLVLANAGAMNAITGTGYSRDFHDPEADMVPFRMGRVITGYPHNVSDYLPRDLVRR